MRGGVLMRSVTYSMGVSLDGYIVGPDGDFNWTAPDEEVFRHWIDEIRGVGVHLLGRRLYETMLYWETADQDPSLDDAELEWAALWNPLPKVVFSTTLSAAQGNARLASGGLAEEIERLQAEPREGDIAIGGATLAAAASPTSGCVGGQGSRTCPAPGSVEREQAGDGRSGVAHRGTGFGPVAVTRRCGTQSSTWTKPSNVAPWRTQTSYSERR